MLVKKLTAGIATATLLGTLLVPAAFANGITITGNGTGSTVVVGVSKTVSKTITQTNSSVVITGVSSTDNTGANNSSFNTGVGSVIATGDATSNTGVGIGGSSNILLQQSCGCQAGNPLSIDVSGNGAGSTVTVGVTKSKTTSITQGNESSLLTSVDNTSNTGGNNSSSNTGGTSGIGTGAAGSTTIVNVTGSQNIFSF